MNNEPGPEKSKKKSKLTREERIKAALRSNLRRRKHKARALKNDKPKDSHSED